MTERVKENEKEYEETASRLDAIRSRQRDISDSRSRSNDCVEFVPIFQGPLHIPEDEIPEDKYYHWVLQSVAGERIDSRILEMCQLGFSFVPPERHARFDMPERMKRENRGYIIVNDLVLMEIDKDYFNKKIFPMTVQTVDNAEKSLENLVGRNKTPFHLRLQKRNERRFGGSRGESEWG